MKTVRCIFAMLLCFALISATEALAAPAMPESTYSGGSLKSVYPYSFDQTWSATLKALQARDFKVSGMNKAPEGNSGEITVAAKQGGEVNIRLTPKDSRNTLVSISGGENAAKGVNALIADQLARG